MNIKSNLCVACALVIFLGLFAGCVSSQSGKASAMDEASLRKRVDLRWDYRIKKQWNAIYEMTTREYRKNNPVNTIGTKTNVTIESYTIHSITVNPAEKSGHAVIKFKINQAGFVFELTANENWLWENGDWYLDIK